MQPQSTQPNPGSDGPQRTYKEEIHDLLRRAAVVRTDPNQFEKFFQEIDEKLLPGETEIASVKHSIDATEITVSYLSKRIKILYDIEDYEDALQSSLELSELLPEHPKVLKGLGDCYRKLRKHEDAIKKYDEALEIIGLDDDNPSLQAHILNNKALSLIEQNRFVNASTALKEAISKDPQNPLYLVTLGKLYKQKGKEAKALENFSKASNLLNQDGSQFDPINEKYLVATLPNVIELMKQKKAIEEAQEKKAKDTEMKKKKAESDAILKRTDDMINEALSFHARRTIRADSITTRSGSTIATELDTLNRIIARNNQKFEDQKELHRNLENRVVGVEDELTELRIYMAVYESLLQTKLDDFKKKIDLEIQDPALKARLLEYYEGFTKTFDLLCTTSLAIASGQVQFNTGSSKEGKIASFLVSFIDVLSTVGPKVINKLDELWSSQEIKKKATRMTQLGSGNDVGQTIGKAAFLIIKDQNYQQRIKSVTNEDLKEHSDKWYKQLYSYLKGVWDKIDVKRHGELYPTAAAKLGNKDADLLVKKWLSEEIKSGNGDLSEVFATHVVAQPNP